MSAPGKAGSRRPTAKMMRVTVRRVTPVEQRALTSLLVRFCHLKNDQGQLFYEFHLGDAGIQLLNLQLLRERGKHRQFFDVTRIMLDHNRRL